MSSRLYIISIRPRFAYRIFSGLKKFELRKWIGIKPDKGSVMVVYASGSVRAIIGEFRVGRVFFAKPSNLKDILSCIKDAGVSYEDYYYIENTKLALAIEVVDPVLYTKPIKLEDIRSILPDFNPPLSIRELSYNEPLYELVIRKAREELIKKHSGKNT